MKTVGVEDKVVPEHTPRQEHTYWIETSLSEGYPHRVYTYYLRGKSVHVCTL